MTHGMYMAKLISFHKTDQQMSRLLIDPEAEQHKMHAANGNGAFNRGGKRQRAKKKWSKKSSRSRSRDARRSRSRHRDDEGRRSRSRSRGRHVSFAGRGRGKGKGRSRSHSRPRPRAAAAAAAGPEPTQRSAQRAPRSRSRSRSRSRRPKPRPKAPVTHPPVKKEGRPVKTERAREPQSAPFEELWGNEAYPPGTTADGIELGPGCSGKSAAGGARLGADAVAAGGFLDRPLADWQKELRKRAASGGAPADGEGEEEEEAGGDAGDSEEQPVGWMIAESPMKLRRLIERCLTPAQCRAVGIKLLPLTILLATVIAIVVGTSEVMSGVVGADASAVEEQPREELGTVSWEASAWLPDGWDPALHEPRAPPHHKSNLPTSNRASKQPTTDKTLCPATRGLLTASKEVYPHRLRCVAGRAPHGVRPQRAEGDPPVNPHTHNKSIETATAPSQRPERVRRSASPAYSAEAPPEQRAAAPQGRAAARAEQSEEAATRVAQRRRRQTAPGSRPTGVRRGASPAYSVVEESEEAATSVAQRRCGQTAPSLRPAR
eukprot:gene11551-14567_t